MDPLLSPYITITKKGLCLRNTNLIPNIVRNFIFIFLNFNLIVKLTVYK